MSDCEGNACSSWQLCADNITVCQVADVVSDLVLVCLLNPMKILGVHLVLQHEQAPRSDQERGHQPLLHPQGAGHLDVLSLLSVELDHSVGAEADGGDGGVEHGAVQVGHDALTRQILIQQHMVSQLRFLVILYCNCLLCPKYSSFVNFVNIDLMMEIGHCNGDNDVNLPEASLALAPLSFPAINKYSFPKMTDLSSLFIMSPWDGGPRPSSGVSC